MTLRPPRIRERLRSVSGVPECAGGTSGQHCSCTTQVNVNGAIIEELARATKEAMGVVQMPWHLGGMRVSVPTDAMTEHPKGASTFSRYGGRASSAISDGRQRRGSICRHKCRRATITKVLSLLCEFLL